MVTLEDIRRAEEWLDTNTAVCMNCQTARKLNEKDWNDKREFDADTKLINDLER